MRITKNSIQRYSFIPKAIPRLYRSLVLEIKLSIVSGLWQIIVEEMGKRIELKKAV